MSDKNHKEILEELQNYEKNNETLAKYKSPLVFENWDLPHASIVIKTIVDFSEHEVLIYDKDLSGDLSSGEDIAEVVANDEAEQVLEEFKKNKRAELLKSFENHLKQGKNLFIVVDEIKNRESETCKKLKEWEKKYPFFLSVSEATDQFKQAVNNLSDSEGRKVSYMAVGDMTSYRVQVKAQENSEAENNPNVSNRNAFVCYNGAEIAKRLGKTFKENLDNKSIFESKVVTA